MKKLIAGAAAVMLVVGISGVAAAQDGSWEDQWKIRTNAGKVQSWDDLSWWGNSGATTPPMRDADRSGYWWWPTNPSSNAGDSELWGNRGVVYSMYSPAPPPPPPVTRTQPPPPPPVAPPTPTPTRSTPVFNNVLFDFDKSTLKPEGRVEVGKIVDELKKHSNDGITVEGHTDNVNRSGDADYNTKLGKRRADAVKAVMVQGGIPAGRISTVSKGDSEPAVSNDTAANRSLNRRVVFKYSIKD